MYRHRSHDTMNIPGPFYCNMFMPAHISITEMELVRTKFLYLAARNIFQTIAKIDVRDIHGCIVFRKVYAIRNDRRLFAFAKRYRFQ